MTIVDEETNRVLRELVGASARIEGAITAIGRRLDDHMAEDIRGFALARSELTTLRDSVTIQFEAHAESRNERLDQQDEQLSEIKRIVDRTKGAWWMLTGIVTVAVTVIGLIIAWLRTPAHH